MSGGWELPLHGFTKAVVNLRQTKDLHGGQDQFLIGIHSQHLMESSGVAFEENGKPYLPWLDGTVRCGEQESLVGFRRQDFPCPDLPTVARVFCSLI